MLLGIDETRQMLDVLGDGGLSAACYSILRLQRMPMVVFVTTDGVVRRVVTVYRDCRSLCSEKLFVAFCVVVCIDD